MNEENGSLSDKNTPKKGDIIIDLTKSRDAMSFDDPREVIQQQAMRSFFEHVKDSLDKVEGFRRELDKSKWERRVYNGTITIDEGRGSGKTTFLLSAFGLIKSGNVSSFMGGGGGSGTDKAA